MQAVRAAHLTAPATETAGAFAWRDYDVMLTGFLTMVLILGLTAIFSAGGGTSAAFIHQSIYLGAGLLAMHYFASTDYHVLGRFWGLAYVAMLMLLILVRVAGHTALGAQRWIYVGFFELQPSEISKLLVIAILARLFRMREARTRADVSEGLITFLMGIAVITPPTALILLQPDLGTAIVFVALLYGMAFMAGVPKRYLIGSVLLFAAALPTIAGHLHGYQQRRFYTFFNPAADPLGAGYNILQAKIAVGSGGIAGRGFLSGTQGQLGFVPARITDFIFAVFSEEWGFVGDLVLLALFLLMLLRVMRAVQLARDQLGRLLAFGIGTMIFFQVLVNVGMNIGVMPVVGIPLPFFSYGGSSMLTNLVSIGVVQSVLTHRRDLRL